MYIVLSASPLGACIFGYPVVLPCAISPRAHGMTFVPFSVQSALICSHVKALHTDIDVALAFLACLASLFVCLFVLESFSIPKLLCGALDCVKGTHFKSFSLGPCGLSCSMQQIAHTTQASGNSLHKSCCSCLHPDKLLTLVLVERPPNTAIPNQKSSRLMNRRRVGFPK